MVRARHAVDKLLEIIYKQGHLKSGDLESLSHDFERSQRDSLTEFLLDEGLVEKENLLAALGKLYNLVPFDVKGIFFETFLLHKFPKDVMLRNAFIPFEVDENTLIVIAADPENENLLSVIGESVSYDVVFFVGLRRDICDAVKEYYDKSLTDIPRDDEIYDHDTTPDPEAQADDIKKS